MVRRGLAAPLVPVGVPPVPLGLSLRKFFSWKPTTVGR